MLALAATAVLPLAASAQQSVGLGNVKPLAEGFSVRAWTVEHGLPQSAVTELVTDTDGYLWGATFGGLFRFDGRAILAYSGTELPVLATNSVTALYARGADLWVGTPTGTIAHLRNGRVVDTLPTPQHDQATTTIDQLLADRDGEVWAREGEDVHHFTAGRWSPRLPYPALSPLVRDRAGRVHFLGASGLVRVEATGAPAVVARLDTGRLQNGLGLHIDRSDRIWMGLQSGLWVLEQGRLRRVYNDGTVVGTIVSDSAGTVWFAAGQRLLRYAPGANARSSAPPEPVLDAGASIVALAFLHDGLLAVGTNAGLLLVRRNPARVLGDPQALPNGEANSIVSRGDGTAYVTSGCGGVYHLDRDGHLLDSLPRPHPRWCTRSLLLDDEGYLWIGGGGTIRRVYAGPQRRDATRRPDTTFALSSFLGEPPDVEALHAQGRTVVFGLSDGRVGRIGPADHVDFLPGWTVPTDVPVQSLTSTSDGALWIGQTGMLSRWYNGDLSYYHGIHGIPNAVPRALLADARGGLWIGTYGSGLWYFRSGSRARALPLPDRTVSALVTDSRDRLWMPGNRGISVVPLASLYRWLADSSEIPGVKLLSFAEGVPEGNNGRPAAASLGGGLFAFASVSGLVEVNSADVQSTGVTPPVHIDSLRSGNGGVIDATGPVRLMPDDRALLVGYSAPSYRFADEMTYRYRLDGRDESWISLGAAREVRVVGLRPGQYTLRIEGRVPSGEWRAAEPLTFEVVPLFTELRWPRVFAFVSVMVLVGLTVLQRVRATEATARAREIALQARRDAAETAEQHQREMAQVSRVAVAGELTASLSHELGQPLAAIVNNAEVARRLLARQAATATATATTPPSVGEAAVGQAVEQALLDVVAQGRRASQVVREFRRFLKREHGERELLGVRELLDSTTLLLRQEFEESRVLLEVQVHPGTPPVHVERVLLQQVLVNLLQNAHEAARRTHPGHAHGQVLVRARPVARGVRVSVVDNGPGFDAAMRRTAFEPFVTTRAHGMGMGLAIARRVIESHGGHVGIGRLPGAGAVVSIWLPVQHIPVHSTDGLLPLQVTGHG